MQIEKAHNIPRETLQTNNKTIKDKKLPIIVTYNKNLPNIKKSRITYRKNKNLGNILGRHLKKQQTKENANHA